MWVLVLVFVGNMGSISTEQTAWFNSQDECIKAASEVKVEATFGRPYSIMAECFPTSGQE